MRIVTSLGKELARARSPSAELRFQSIAAPFQEAVSNVVRRWTSGSRRCRPDMDLLDGLPVLALTVLSLLVFGVVYLKKVVEPRVLYLDQLQLANLDTSLGTPAVGAGVQSGSGATSTSPEAGECSNTSARDRVSSRQPERPATAA